VPLPSALKLGVDPTARRPLRDEAYLSLRRAILSGDFKPGDRLVEREVANKLDLSRSPVREAFRRLEQEGLVSVNRQGLFVQAVAPAEVEELYLIRQHLESLVARLAARNYTAAYLPRLEEVVSSLAAAGESGDKERIVAEGARFHSLLAEIAGNRRLAKLTASIVEEIDRFRRLNLAAGPRTVLVLGEHRRMLDAVIAGDEGRAAALMFEHIGDSLAAAKVRGHMSGAGEAGRSREA
jgi:DNA-binding GntR family transcriptional regulator